MENNFDNLFDKLNESVNSEDQLFKFYTNRLISEIGNLLLNCGINFKSQELVTFMQRLVYYSLKVNQNKYVTSINEINNELGSFIKMVNEEGTNSLECGSRANDYRSKINTINSEVNYEKEFNNLKKQIISILGNDNQQLGYKLDGILNYDKSSLETEVIKIRDGNKRIFEEMAKEIEKLGFTNPKRRINPNSQMDLIRDFLISFNHQNEDEISQKIMKSFDYFSLEIGSELQKNINGINDKKAISAELLNLFTNTFKQSYPLFNNKLNGEFIDMLLKRLEEALPKEDEPKFEISRDSITYQNVKKFSSENHLVDLDMLFAYIIDTLKTKFQLDASDPKYTKILAMLNTKKAEMDNSLQKQKDNILIQNIIELQSQINKIFYSKTIIIEKNN